MKENIPSMRVWLAVAENDLVCSKILLDSEKYPNALFLLQQSAEKLIKSLHSFGLNPKEIRKTLGHDILKAFLKHLRKKRCLTIKQITDLTKSNYSEQNSLSKLIYLQDEYEKCERAIKEYEPLKNEGIGLSKSREEIGNIIKKIKEGLSNIDVTLLKIKKERTSLSDDEDGRNFYIQTGCFDFYFAKIQHLSFLLFAFLQPHFDFVRYPREKQNSPLEDYNKSTPIITKLPELIKIQERLLREHREFLAFIRYMEKEFKVFTPVTREFFDKF